LALPESANHSEWAATSVLRTGWSREDPRLVAVWPDRTVRFELENKRDVIWSGLWELEVRCDGRPAEPKDVWDEVCWVSDDDVDYLELETELAGGIRVQRHILLAREDGFLLLADSVLGQRTMDLEYRQSLPLWRTVAFEPADETSEGYLVSRKKRALVLPLGLPEWRTELRDASLAPTERGLELRQTTRGQALFAPLFVDLNTRRMATHCTWRRLTVAENRETLSSDMAVGYRVMVGKDQWLIYRSLGETGNRTVLGHNLVTEFLVARFDHEGEVETLVEIE
jgi:hypothetical protein